MKAHLDGRPRRVLVAGDDALLLVELRLKATTPEGEALEEEGMATDVMRRQADGTGRYVIDLPEGGAATAR